MILIETGRSLLVASTGRPRLKMRHTAVSVETNDEEPIEDLFSRLE